MSHFQERSNFIGKQNPSEVKILCKNLKKLDAGIFAKIVKVAGKMLSDSNPDHKKFQDLTSGIDQNLLHSLYPGVITIFRRALRLPPNKLNQKDFVHDLTELNIPAAFHSPLVEVLFGENRNKLDESASADRPRFSTATDFRWRVDVGISTASLKRVLEPSVLCSIKTSNNTECTFEITKEKFHELRYAVTEVLNHMQQLEKRSILNIDV